MIDTQAIKIKSGKPPGPDQSPYDPMSDIACSLKPVRSITVKSIAFNRPAAIVVHNLITAGPPRGRERIADREPEDGEIVP